MSPADQLVKTLKRTFADICNGYSSAIINGEVAYIKHLSHFDHLEFEDLGEKFVKEATENGLLTEEQRLEQIIKQGIWSKAKEDEIFQLEDFIARLEEGKKGISVPSVLKNHESVILEEKKKLQKLLQERANLIGLTVEIHASGILNDYYILNNLFKDKELKVPMFTHDVLDPLSDKEVGHITEQYTASVEPCSDKNIKKLSVQPFFQQYFFVCNNDVSAFFGKPVYLMTNYQVNLANYAMYFKEIASQTDLSNLTPEQRKDPDEIEKYVNLKRNADQALQEGKVPTNMTPSDIKALGLEGKMSKMPSEPMNSQQFMEFLSKQKKG